MSLALLSSLSTRVRTSDPLDRAAHARDLDAVCEASAFVRNSGSPQAVACLLGAGHALQALVAVGEHLPLADVHRIAGELLRIVYLTVASTCERRAAGAAGGAPPEVPAPALVRPIAAPIAAPAAAPLAAPLAALPTAPLTAPAVAPEAAPLAAPPAAPAVAAAAEAPARSEVRQSLLGRMLLSLGHVTRADLARALRMHRTKRLPVGECLLVLGACRPALVLEAIRLQAEARSDARGRGLAPRPPPAAGAAPSRPSAAFHITKDIFFGEVLLGFGMISNDQLEQAMHLHHHLGVRVGAALVKIGALTEEDVERGLELQRRLQSVATVKARR